MFLSTVVLTSLWLFFTTSQSLIHHAGLLLKAFNTVSIFDFQSCKFYCGRMINNRHAIIAQMLATEPRFVDKGVGNILKLGHKAPYEFALVIVVYRLLNGIVHSNSIDAGHPRLHLKL